MVGSLFSSPSFDGTKDGFVFKSGEAGVGYYPDQTPSVAASADTAEMVVKPVEPPRDWAIGMRVVDEDGFFATVRYALQKKKTACG